MMITKQRPTLQDQTILVTGGAGFIGSHLVDRLLLEKPKQIIVVDNLFLGNLEHLEGASKAGVVLYREDAEIATSLAYIFEKHNIDVVFNCATKPINYSFFNPANCALCSVHIVTNLLELLRHKAYQTLCHFSTSEVYGTAVYEPMDEAHPMHPKTTYAAGKVAADKILESYVESFQVDAMIVRPFNNYGPRQNYLPPLEGVIPRTIYRILQGLPPQIYGSGEQSRDFIHVSDTVSAIVQVYPVLAAGEQVNISTDNQVTIGDLIRQVSKIMNYTGDIESKEARTADVFCHQASNQKIRSLIDYQLTPFQQGLEQTVEWYLDKIGKKK